MYLFLPGVLLSRPRTTPGLVPLFPGIFHGGKRVVKIATSNSGFYSAAITGMYSRMNMDIYIYLYITDHRTNMNVLHHHELLFSSLIQLSSSFSQLYERYNIMNE